MKNHRKTVYMIVISFCLLLSFISFILDKTTAFYIDLLVWAIFTVDVLYNLAKSKDKRAYLKGHILDFVAIVPYFAFFRWFKTLSLILFLVRSTKLGKRYFLPVYQYMANSMPGRAILGIVLIFLLLPIPMVWLEPQMKSYADVMWWAIQTTTTVGYGDIVPVTVTGRIIGSILMILGVGLISSLSSMLTHYMLRKHKLSVSEIFQHVEALSVSDLHQVEQHISKLKNEFLHKNAAAHDGADTAEPK